MHNVSATLTLNLRSICNSYILFIIRSILLVFQLFQTAYNYKKLCSYRIGFWYLLNFFPVYVICISAKSHIGATLLALELQELMVVWMYWNL